MVNSWYDRWLAAYEKASFYRSEKNTIKYWNEVANSDSSGLLGTEHIEMLDTFLFRNNYLDENCTVLDIGCGLGDYALHFAPKCKWVTAMDYSGNMIEQCRLRSEERNIANMSYLLEDIKEYKKDVTYDGVLACLNPSTYSPDVFEKLLKLADKFVVYFSMDVSIEEAPEPIYHGTNSVRYPEEYLKELGIPYTKIPYEYIMKQPDNSCRHIPFAYLIVDVSEKKYNNGETV